MGMNYLITGGGGFIGSHLTEVLIERGHRVVAIDDLSTGRIDNIRHLLKHPHFRFVHRSLTDRMTLEELIKEVDIVFHLAAAVGVRLIVTQPVKSIETNIQGTQIVLDLADKYRKKVLITSTSEVYGKSIKTPFREEDDMVLGPTVRQRWSYACSKAIDEFLAISFYRQTALPVVIVRLFNTVGPRQVSQYGMVIPRFVEQALLGDAITVYSDGSQVRCFLHVRDAVEYMLELVHLENAEGEIFNVGSDEPITILELAKKIVAKTQSSSQIVHLPYEQVYGKGFEDIHTRIPDISKLHSFVKWRKKYSLDQILDEVIVQKREELGM